MGAGSFLKENYDGKLDDTCSHNRTLKKVPLVNKDGKIIVKNYNDYMHIFTISSTFCTLLRASKSFNSI